MKKRLFLLLCPALLLGLLTGCHLFHVMDGPGMEYKGGDNVPAEDTKPDTPEKETGKIVTGKDVEVDESGAAYTLSDYLSVERIETPCGVIEMPRLELEKLPDGDARLVEQMFRDMEEVLLQWAEECASEAENNGYPLEAEDREALRCQTKAALHDDILSVLVCYETMDYYAPSMTLHEAVSLNVKTGAAVSPAELLELAGYDPEEASDILRSYAEDCMTSQWRSMVSWSDANGDPLPDNWGDPDLGWQDVLDEMLREVWEEPQPLGVSWDTLERSPAMFYEGGDRLSVCAPIPTLAGAGFTETMVNLGHGSDAIHDRNPLDCFGEPFS